MPAQPPLQLTTPPVGAAPMQQQLLPLWEKLADPACIAAQHMQADAPFRAILAGEVG